MYFNLRKRLFWVLPCLLLLISCDSEETHQKTKGLQPPFDLSDIQDRVEKPFTANFKCKETPEPIHDLHFNSMYSKASKNSSEVDQEAYAKYLRDTENIKILESQLTVMGNRYLMSWPHRIEIAQCMLNWMDDWAIADGFMGEANHMGEFVRKWALASISLAFLQIRSEENLDEDQKIRVKDWIHRLTAQVIADFSRKPEINSRNNNHMYWAVWGVANGAVVNNDQEQFNWAMKQAKRAISHIQMDGTLPTELIRGKKAYNYHHYAAIPLFYLAQIAQANGINLYKENDHGLQRLAKRLLLNIDDQSYFQTLTGKKQDLTRTITYSNLVWLVPYYKEYKDPDALKLLRQFHPVRHSRVGGNAVFLYGKTKSYEND
ncbi:MAG: alginate lyase family protein [Alphaproteobacteria bacterium]|nr:alginate lyase family protein [Alphaproteobacteria bacterium]